MLPALSGIRFCNIVPIGEGLFSYTAVGLRLQDSSAEPLAVVLCGLLMLTLYPFSSPHRGLAILIGFQCPSSFYFLFAFWLKHLLFLTYSSRFCLLGCPIAREIKTSQFQVHDKHPLLKQSPWLQDLWPAPLPAPGPTLLWLGSAEPF